MNIKCNVKDWFQPKTFLDANTENNKFFPLSKVQKDSTSATVTISATGRARAKMLKETTENDTYLKDEEVKIDKILNTIREGGTLSKEEQELVNNELKNMSEQKYKEYKDLRLKPEDVMTELKENYMRRQKLFFDMQKQLEAEANGATGDIDTVKLMSYMQERENDEKIIEMMEECVEDEEETISEREKESMDTSDSILGEGEITISTGEVTVEETQTTDNCVQKQALKQIENIENQMNDVDEKRNESSQKEHSFANGLEEDYKRIQQVLGNEEISVEEKVKAYDRFVAEAHVNARGREVERIKKQFDAETLMMARIMFLGRRSLDDASNKNVEQSLIGTEFVKSFFV